MYRYVWCAAGGIDLGLADYIPYLHYLGSIRLFAFTIFQYRAVQNCTIVEYCASVYKHGIRDSYSN